MNTEPARYVAILVGVLTAAYAAISVLASGGDTLLAVLAGLGALITALGGGEIVRANVEPEALALERRDLAVREARGEDVTVEPTGRSYPDTSDL